MYVKINEISVGQLLDMLWHLYQAGVAVNGNEYQSIDPIVIHACTLLGLHQPSSLNRPLTTVYNLCLQGETRYHMALEVDMTPTEAAAYHRRNPRNKVEVEGIGTVRLIAMKKVR